MPDDQFIRRAQPWLGTFVEITVPMSFAESIDGAFKKIAEVHSAMSFHSDTSDLALLRRAAPGDLIKVKADTVNVLREAQRFYELTDGLFNVCVAAELIEWGFLPKPTDIDSYAYESAAQNIEIVDETHLRLSQPLLIDLGGIAKGFAVDLVVEYLEISGVDAGCVNAGGDLRVFGDLDFPFVLRAPDWSGRIEELTLRNGAAATSSNFGHRKTINDQIRTPHVNKQRDAAIFNGSVTVFSPFAIYADALTKIAICDAEMAAMLAPTFEAEIFMVH